MRKFKPFPPRGLQFRWLLILTGALVLLAAFAPRAKADLIAYFNFEGTPTPPYAVNLASQVPPGFATTTLILTDGSGNPYPSSLVTGEAGIPLNVAPGDPDPNLTDIHIVRTVRTLNMDIPLTSSQGIYDVTSVSFAYRSNGNSFVQLQYSTNNGITFQNISGLIALPRIVSHTGSVINIPVPAGTTINVSNLVLRLHFTGGQAQEDFHTAFDNIQVNGTIVPEPATVAGGLLGLLGLCWFQRKRLIRSVRFRRT